MAGKLTDTLRAEVVALRTQRKWTYARIRRWLARERGVDISQQGLSQALAGAKAQALAGEMHTAPEINPADAIAVLDALLARLDKLSVDATAPIELKVIEQVRKIVETRTKVSDGMGAEDASARFVDNVIDLAGLALAEEDDDARLRMDPSAFLAARGKALAVDLDTVIEALPADVAEAARMVVNQLRQEGS